MLLAYLARLDNQAVESLINHGEESSARESTLPDVGRAQLIRFVIGDRYRGTSTLSTCCRKRGGNQCLLIHYPQLKNRGLECRANQGGESSMCKSTLNNVISAQSVWCICCDNSLDVSTIAPWWNGMAISDAAVGTLSYSATALWIGIKLQGEIDLHPNRPSKE